ncbi:zinc finger CCCH domain-containing protein 19 [Dendrobium catenatum]|uniref:Zinc finger CCCH domain-containing protein 19 n=1 Tax=Dendrobium catenatum TaxID=906689 RepID=A0A2I0XIQ8_9ASPA|nr:zinc finger CCCH domain-containing protein 19 [Dendrobium catenatum]PKU87779.1 Zinc finger CCCH domain-containing protein 19 [Dendrobium catenatum]
MESGGGRSDPRPLTREEEAVKRNTDCVYFLASPLTCKKGSECEYRHSEGARINPRDCKFWFSGNCLNPKCLFRHPPLDVPFGNPVATSGSNMAPSLAPTPMQLPMASLPAYNLSRNNVPCYYFQKGACLKGDKCPFVHGPQPAGNSVTKQTAKASVPVTAQLDTTRKDAWKLKEYDNQQNFPKASKNAGKQVTGASSSVESSIALENAKVHRSSSTSLLRPSSFHVQSDGNHSNEHEAGEILGEPSGVVGTKSKRPLNQQIQSSRYKNDMGVEVIREFSPGFDVLVNNVVKVADYLHDKDGFRSGSIQGGRNMSHGDGYGQQHQCDPESTASEFRHYGKVQHGIDGDQHGNFSVSERIKEKPILPVRRSAAHKLRSPDGMDETDLRYRLMKQRRLNSSLSATISDSESKPYGRHEQKMQDRHPPNSYRDQRLLPPESTISSRLRGRITLSKPSSPEIASDLQGGGGRGRQRGNLSPVRTSSLQRRLGERLSRRPIEDFTSNARNIGSQQKSRDSVDPLDFAGPRSLAELKGAKPDVSSEGQSSKNVKSTSSLEHNGMKSLKRNREVRPDNDAISGVSNDRKAIGAIEVGSSASEAAPVPELRSQDAFEASLEWTKVITNLEDPAAATMVEEEGEIEEEVVHIPADVEQITYEKQAAEDETEARDAAEEDELDYTDQRDGEYDYETIDGGDYKTEDYENMDPMNLDDEEEDEDDDEDDFAKKIGLIFS